MIEIISMLYKNKKELYISTLIYFKFINADIKG